MRTIVFLAAMLLFVNCTIAQTNIDSLEKVLKLNLQDSNRVKALYTLSDALENSEPKKAVEYANEGLILAQKISFKKGIGTCLNALGNAYSTLGEYHKAFQYYLERQKIAIAIKDSLGIAASYDNIGILYSQWGKIDSALQLRIEAIKIYLNLHDERHLANGYIWVGNILTDRSDYAEALDYYFKSIKILEKLQDPNIGYAYINVSNIYRLNKQFDNAKKFAIDGKRSFTQVKDKYGVGASLYRLALVYNDEGDHKNAILNLLEAKQTFKEIGDVQTIASTDNLIGDIYRQMGYYENAQHYLKDALFTAKKIEDNSLVAVTTGNLGLVYKEQGNFPEAVEYLKESYAMLKSLNNRNTANSLKDLVEVYAHLNNPDSAIKYFQLYQETSDTIYNEQSAKAIAEMQTKYETQKKTDSLVNQQNLLSLKNKSISKQNYFIGGLVILVLSITGLFILSYRQSKKIGYQYQEIQQLQSELKHRTGNFFSSIKGMMSAALITSSDKETITAIDYRVNTIFHLFKTLYSSPINQQLSFSDLLTSICNDFEYSFGKEKNIHIYAKTEAIVDKEETVPLSFIITELLTNSYKHAFDDNFNSEIHVEVSKKEGVRALCVWDNGKGMPENMIQKATSQGMNIIKNYSKALGGNIHTWNDNGFHFKMEF